MEKQSNQEHTEDQLKQVEFLQTTYLRYLESQNEQYKDLSSKITFLFGFVVATITFYGTNAINTNPSMRYVALGLFGLTTLLLSIAYKNRTYFRPHRLSSSVDKSSYFNKVYKDAVNIELTTTKNNKPLQAMGKWVRWSIWTFTIGLIALVLSFFMPHKTVVNSVHEYNHNPQTTHTRPR